MEHQNNKENTIIEVKNLNFFYGEKQVLFDINMKILDKNILALIGPSGCGKTTFLRCLNRMNDLISTAKYDGNIEFGTEKILHPKTDIIKLRKKIGMVFQKSNPFPKSIYENVIYGLRIAGQNKKSVLNEAAEKALRQAALFDEVKDRLTESAMGLSGGQMQRLCIARTIAIRPEVILMDEPCSALDPRSTAKIEELLLELKSKYSIIIVTHNMQQASRVSNYTAFFFEGVLVEYDYTKKIFTNPKHKKTEDYITGKFG